jgi:hypothetical protein
MASVLGRSWARFVSATWPAGKEAGLLHALLENVDDVVFGRIRIMIDGD